MTTTTVKNGFVPESLVSGLEKVLISGAEDQVGNSGTKSGEEANPVPSPAEIDGVEANHSPNPKPVVLVTNAEGVESSGLTLLVEALVLDGRFDVHVCAPQTDKPWAGHGVTARETIVVSSVEMSGATAFEVSGTPADCVSLALSGALFSWSKPVLVISGVNKGSNCGQNMFYSGAAAGAREALICGVPSLCLSLNWKKDLSCESDLKDVVSVCLPLIYAASRDIEKGAFPKSCSLNVEIPTSPLTSKGLKVTRQSLKRPSLNWQAVSATRNPSAAHFMSNQQSLGLQLAQLSRDASAAGAARRLNSQRRNVEIESVGVAAKLGNNKTVKKYFRLELSIGRFREEAGLLVYSAPKELEKKDEEIIVEEDLDFRAVQDGFVSVTPLCLSSTVQCEIQTSVSNWIHSLKLAELR